VRIFIEPALSVGDAHQVEHLAGAITSRLPRHAEMALDLRADLTAGAACPVCEQPVHTLPKKGAAPKVAASKKSVDSAEKAEAKARTAREAASAAEAAARAGVAEAEQTASKAAADLKQAELDLAAAEVALSSIKSQLVDRLGEGDPRLLLEAREEELATAQSAVADAEKEVESARHTFDLATESEREAGSDPAGLANRLAGIWGRLEQDRERRQEVRHGVAEDADAPPGRGGAAVRVAAGESAGGVQHGRPFRAAASVDRTYQLPLRKIVISSWLGEIMSSRFGSSAEVIVTPVDAALFHRVPVEREEEHDIPGEELSGRRVRRGVSRLSARHGGPRRVDRENAGERQSHGDGAP
jgi:hypothetical protein